MEQGIKLKKSVIKSVIKSEMKSNLDIKSLFKPKKQEVKLD